MLEKINNAINSVVKPAATNQTPRKADAGGIYQVRPGDTIGQIAKEFGMSVDDLKAMNPQVFKAQTGSAHVRKRLDDGHWIYAGDKLRIKPAQPTDQGDFRAAAIARAKQTLDGIGGELAGTHGHNIEAASAVMQKGYDALAAIPAGDKDRATYEAKMKDAEGLFNQYFPKKPAVQPKPEPVKPDPKPVVPPAPVAPVAPQQTQAEKEAAMRQGLANYIGRVESTPNADFSANIRKELANNPEYVKVASPAQKAKLIEMVTKAQVGKDERQAVGQILDMANDRKELGATLDGLGKKGMKRLMEQMGDSAEGVKLAKTMLAAGAYTENNRYQNIEDNASRGLLKALGFTDPPKGRSTELAALPEALKQHLLKKLDSGNVSWQELHMVQWVNQHVEVPHTVQTVNGPVS